MLIGASLFVAVFVVGFGHMTVDVLRSGKLRGWGWFVGRAEAPIRYWTGTIAYGSIAMVAAAFLLVLLAVIFVR